MHCLQPGKGKGSSALAWALSCFYIALAWASSYIPSGGISLGSPDSVPSRHCGLWLQQAGPSNTAKTLLKQALPLVSAAGWALTFVGHVCFGLHAAACSGNAAWPFCCWDSLAVAGATSAGMLAVLLEARVKAAVATLVALLQLVSVECCLAPWQGLGIRTL